MIQIYIHIYVRSIHETLAYKVHPRIRWGFLRFSGFLSPVEGSTCIHNTEWSEVFHLPKESSIQFGLIHHHITRDRRAIKTPSHFNLLHSRKRSICTPTRKTTHVHHHKPHQTKGNQTITYPSHIAKISNSLYRDQTSFRSCSHNQFSKIGS
jgi:hypothetical protein